MPPRRAAVLLLSGAAAGAVLVGTALPARFAPSAALAGPATQVEDTRTTLRGANIRLRVDPSDAAEEVAILQDGEPVEITGPGAEVDGHVWWPILVTATADEGWVRWEFLVGGSPVLAPGAVPAAPAADDAADNPGRNRNRDRNADAEPTPEPTPEPTAEPAADGQNDRQRNRNRQRNNDTQSDPAAEDAEASADDAEETGNTDAEETEDADTAPNALLEAGGGAGTADAGTFASPGGRLVYVATHEGDGPFVVTVIDADGVEETVLDKEGAYDGQRRFETAEGDVTLRVEATGTWILQVLPPA